MLAHSAARTRECGWMVGLGAGVTDPCPFSLPGAASSGARRLSVFDADSGLLARVAASAASPAAPGCGVGGAVCCRASHALCSASSALSTLRQGSQRCRVVPSWLLRLRELSQAVNISYEWSAWNESALHPKQLRHIPEDTKTPAISRTVTQRALCGQAAARPGQVTGH